MIMLMMAMDEKTEKPTPKKKRDTREKGYVLKSNDVNAAFILVASFAVLKLFGKHIANSTMNIMSNYLAGFDAYIDELSVHNASTIFLNLAMSIFVIMIPILVFAVISAVLINYLQVGFLLTSKTLVPKFSKLNPLAGIKRMVSIRSFVELAKSAVKAVIIIYIAYSQIKASIDIFPALMSRDIGQSVGMAIDFSEKLALKIGIALFVIAAFDYGYQWWEYYRNLRMTKQEVKEELKQTEGDPKVKSQIRQRQMRIGRARMMNDVKEATVVITNPTHYAVALRYDEKKDAAPRVVAKGKDYIALKIKEIAREHKIEIVEDKPLAQALFKAAEIGDVIPQEFFVAVAQILAEIYRAKKLSEV